MQPFKKMSQLDKLIHEPARLSIMSALESCSLAEFLFLQELTGLTKGNLSSHVSKLERAGYIRVDKRFVRKKIPHTTLYITNEGKAAIQHYWRELDLIREMTKEWNASPSA